MNRLFRQIVFVFYSVFLQWPVFILFWIMGKFGLIKTLFLIYPTDRDECLDFCPDIKWLRRFYSGRPTPTGLIMNGFIPMGVYFLVPNTAMELVSKKNRFLVDNIIRRMLFFKKLTGAKTIGLAGQLGPVFEKHLGEPLTHPFYTSTFGNIFSIQSAVNHVVKSLHLKPWQTKIAILGGGDLSVQLDEQLKKDLFITETINIKYTRKGNVKLVDEKLADQQLNRADFAINLLPRGVDFIDCDIHNRLPKNSTIIDFSRPQLQPKEVPQNVVMGNRVQSSGISFVTKLPGGWKSHEIPACSMPCILSSLGSLKFRDMAEFRLAATHFPFFTALEERPQVVSPSLVGSSIKLPVTTS